MIRFATEAAITILRIDGRFECALAHLYHGITAHKKNNVNTNLDFIKMNAPADPNGPGRGGY
jgi:hypothetical protein